MNILKRESKKIENMGFPHSFHISFVRDWIRTRSRNIMHLVMPVSMSGGRGKSGFG